MTTPQPRPAGKGTTLTPNGPHVADRSAPPAPLGEPTGAARKGVRTALRSDVRRGDGRYPVAWLTIRAPSGATPSAVSVCLCGRDRRAFGKARVLALIADHDDHRTACPLRTPQEGRTAA